MRSLHLGRRARKDLESILRYYATDKETFAGAAKLVDELVGYCRVLAANPALVGSLEPRIGKNVRRTVFKGYRIYVRYRRKQLDVVRIIHGKRNFPA